MILVHFLLKILQQQPIRPNLFTAPANKPDIANAKTCIGVAEPIIPNIKPIETPIVLPTSNPFFHAKIKIKKQKVHLKVKFHIFYSYLHLQQQLL